MSSTTIPTPAELVCAITLYAGKQKPKGKPLTLPWPDLVARLSRHQVRTGKDGPLWSPARLDPENCHRKNIHVRGLQILAGDVDDCSEPDALLLPLAETGIEHVAYTSFSYEPDHSKYRFAIPLTREVSPDEWPQVWRGFVHLYGRGHLDSQCSDPSRAYYEPSTIPKSKRQWEPWTRHHAGRALDPDELIAAAPPPPPKPEPRAMTDFPRNGHRPDPRIILERSLKSTEGKARHYRGYHLAEQLRDNGYSESEAEPVVLELQRILEHSGDHPYPVREALASLAYAYTKPARDPWPEREFVRDHEPGPCYHADPPPRQPKTPTTSVSLADVTQAFRKRLYLPDDSYLKVTLAAYAANRIKGQRVWIMIIGPPGSGKTEVITSLNRQPDVHLRSCLSGESALLSGTSKKDRTASASGGLLREIGDFGVLALKDFTSILSLKHEQRAPLLAALREVYDGTWSRSIGTDGGRTLSWSGKLGIIAGCTPAIDSHHAVIGAMGERFVFYRLPPTDAAKQAAQALKNYGHEEDMQRELAAAVTGLFASVDFDQVAAELSPAATARLIDLACLAARCRSAVERDGRTHEITLIPPPEAPARLAGALRGLFQGMRVIGMEPSEAWALLAQVAVDSMPALRWSVLWYASQQKDGETTPTADFATATSHPTTTVRRALEDLNAHQLLQRSKFGQSHADHWEATPWTRDMFKRLGSLFRKLPQHIHPGDESEAPPPPPHDSTIHTFRDSSEKREPPAPADEPAAEARL